MRPTRYDPHFRAPLARRESAQHIYIRSDRASPSTISHVSLTSRSGRSALVSCIHTGGSMWHPNRRSFAIGRIVAVLLLAVAVATPASAQFGALKKKLKGDAAAKAVEKTGEAGGGDASSGGANTP